jgi:hypothetical protein
MKKLKSMYNFNIKKDLFKLILNIHRFYFYFGLFLKVFEVYLSFLFLFFFKYFKKFYCEYFKKKKKNCFYNYLIK